jgi:hypothetical protein
VRVNAQVRGGGGRRRLVVGDGFFGRLGGGNGDGGVLADALKGGALKDALTLIKDKVTEQGDGGAASLADTLSSGELKDALTSIKGKVT